MRSPDAVRMFDLKAPCANCPFKRGIGETFRLEQDRLAAIVAGDAFQCHKTVDYSGYDTTSPGDNPRQCAGLMATLRNSGQSNVIMRVGVLFGVLDVAALDPRGEAYASVEDAMAAHAGVQPGARVGDKEKP
jgi:hypothetical protein